LIDLMTAMVKGSVADGQTLLSSHAAVFQSHGRERDSNHLHAWKGKGENR
jgi:hypothetical protein